MRFMLDTNICIFMIRSSDSHVLEQVRENMGAGLCISSITLAELIYGVENSSRPEKNRIALMQFLSIMEVRDFSPSAAQEYGRIRAHLSRRGTPIGPMDMLIAAHAKAEKLTLVTNNTKEFMRVPELDIVDWT